MKGSPSASKTWAIRLGRGDDQDYSKRPRLIGRPHVHSQPYRQPLLRQSENLALNQPEKAQVKPFSAVVSMKPIAGSGDRSLMSQVNLQHMRNRGRPPPIVRAPIVTSTEAEEKVCISFVADLCPDCHSALSGVLTRSYVPERWVHVVGSDTTIAYYRQHHSNTLLGLRTSASRGCKVCNLMEECLRDCAGADPGDMTQYSLFVDTRSREPPEICLCLGDASRFSRSGKEWESSQPAFLRFFSSTQSGSHGVNSQFDTYKTLQCSLRTILNLQKLPDSDLGCEKNFQAIRAWLRDCIDNHPNCRRAGVPLPKRLVDIRALDTQRKVYLCFPSLTDTWRYATVTYSWGEKGKNRRMPTKNDKPHLTEAHHQQSGIDINRFPLTLQNAMRVAQMLGFRYIWIDSVCIVQDSPADWDEQVTKLVQIYAGADLNISATSGLASEYGILRTLGSHGVHVADVRDDLSKRSATEHRDHLSIRIGKRLQIVDMEDMPAATRGWVFQERLVSPATLHYTDVDIIWECAQHTRLTGDHQMTKADYKQQWLALMNLTNIRPGDSLDETATQAVCGHWNRWMAAYAARNLHDFTDRLPAIAGLANTIQNRLGLHYMDGLWREDLLNGLLWKRWHECDSLTRFQHDIIPSWNWASVQGRLEFVRKALIEYPENGVNVELLVPNTNDSRVRGVVRARHTRINVRGLLEYGHIELGWHPEVRQRSSQEVGVASGFMNVANVQVMLDAPTQYKTILVPCWFLRIGSFEDDGRVGDLFLVLEKSDEQQGHFKRIGLAQTEPWSDRLFVTTESGRFVSPDLVNIILI